jgi:hypothetical protein
LVFRKVSSLEEQLQAKASSDLDKKKAESEEVPVPISSNTYIIGHCVEGKFRQGSERSGETEGSFNGDGRSTYLGWYNQGRTNSTFDRRVSGLTYLNCNIFQVTDFKETTSGIRN